MSPSTETIVNIIFGIVACLIAIGGVVATVRAGRNQRDGQIDFGGAIRRGQTFRLVRFTALEYFHSDDNGRSSLPVATRDITAQQR
ncbi:hypothetical protein F4824DRAFT_503903 [Ustulina deusta]|nr:hypothetical protein F4824DRAFT_503903 [Ustulina deusta]